MYFVNTFHMLMVGRGGGSREVAGAERWREQRGGGSREVAGAERWREQRGGGSREVAGAERWEWIMSYTLRMVTVSQVITESCISHNSKHFYQ